MNPIDRLSCLHTTQEIIHYYRKSDSLPLLDTHLETCSVGNYRAIQHVLHKGVVPIRQHIERPELEYADIIESMKE